VTSPELLPWQQQNLNHVLQLRQAGRMPHALMLNGRPGTGIRQFATVLAGIFMCSEDQPLACGHCHSCRLNAAGTHPDLMLLEPERDGGPIKVDQVREVVAFGQASAQQGGYRLVIVCPAEAMNANAANSLLKTLEEPGANTLLLLVSYAPTTVLPTIRSRCQLMAMATPNIDQSRDWLRRHLSDPSVLDMLYQFVPEQPLYGLRLEAMVAEMQVVAETLPALIEGRADILQTAQQWSSVDLGHLLMWLYQWLSNACLIEGQLRPDSDVAVRIHRSWVARAPLDKLIDQVDRIVGLRRQLASGANPNRQLLLENLALNMTARGSASWPARFGSG
jgi:DNA polymerase-3 subunit delta'